MADFTRTRWDVWAQHPHFVHIFTTAFLGKTYEHLVNDHGESGAFDLNSEAEPIGETKQRRNARLHLRAHTP
jgi:hypothetical protein